MSTHLSDWGSYQKRTLRQNLTQDELGERIGVQKAQISRMERGYSIGVF
ncbi:MAG: helix-turn-helix transcriptional regulator [Alloprevotella sp.]|nr:helix-turn-helix transcriptional regulator [Alloprevotella sp.]MDY5769480.1 helix-turn-helix transcriptional regulator [Alloprevotella sp.]